MISIRVITQKYSFLLFFLLPFLLIFLLPQGKRLPLGRREFPKLRSTRLLHAIITMGQPSYGLWDTLWHIGVVCKCLEILIETRKETGGNGWLGLEGAFVSFLVGVFSGGYGWEGRCNGGLLLMSVVVGLILISLSAIVVTIIVITIPIPLFLLTIISTIPNLSRHHYLLRIHIFPILRTGLCRKVLNRQLRWHLLVCASLLALLWVLQLKHLELLWERSWRVVEGLNDRVLLRVRGDGGGVRKLVVGVGWFENVFVAGGGFLVCCAVSHRCMAQSE